MSIQSAASWLSRLMNVVMAFIVIAVAAPKVGPALESAWFPVIEASLRGGVTTDMSGHTCWGMFIQKKRVASPLSVDYYTWYEGTKINFIAYREIDNTLLVKRGFSNRPTGDSFLVRYCVDLPKPLVGKSLTVEGSITYETHGFWFVVEDLPSFRMPPTRGILPSLTQP